MNEDTKEFIKGLVWLGVGVGCTVGATYVALKISTKATAFLIAKELLKRGAVLTTAVV